MGGTPNHPKLDHFAFETYGFGDPQFSEPPPIWDEVTRNEPPPH